MPRKLLLAPLVCVPIVFGLAQNGGSAPSKETLYYNIEWRLINAGKLRIDLQPEPQPTPGWMVNLHLESVGLVSKLFKVEDDYSSTLNPSMCVETTQLTAHEGSRQRQTRVTFDYESKKAAYLERDRIKNTTVLAQETEIPACVHDVAGGLFFLRTLNLEVGQSVEVPVSDGKRSVRARIEAQQREEVKTPAGPFHTIRYEIFLFNDVLYKRSGHLYVWLTDDRRKLPVALRVRLQITIGTINLQLAKYE